jgi:fumarylacetoacetate (FAA) hydrolase family protein
MMIPLPPEGLFVGRVWREGLGPSLVALRAGRVFDITSRAAPTLRDLMEISDIPAFIATQAGEDIGSLEDIAAMSVEAGPEATRLLAPCDLQAVKACGGWFPGLRKQPR